MNRMALRPFRPRRLVLALAWMLSTSTASVAAQTSGLEPQPACRSTQPATMETHVGDGTADPDGRIAYAVVGRYDELLGPIGTSLRAIDPDGSDHVRLLDCDVLRPQWSPDGTRLAFTLGFDDGSWQVATVAADGSDLRVLTTGPGINEIPSWSPDGSWLAFDATPSHAAGDPADPDFRATLWRIDADGSDAALLGGPDTFDVEPRVSPDGRSVAFVRWFPEDDWRASVMIRDLTTGEERPLTEFEGALEHPEWSPDGRSIVANGQDGSPIAGTVLRFDVDQPGSEPTVVHDGADGVPMVKPVVAPDGASLVVVCGHATDDLCLIDVGGSEIRPLVDDPQAHENHPTWGVAASGG